MNKYSWITHSLTFTPKTYFSKQYPTKTSAPSHTTVKISSTVDTVPFERT